MLGDGEGRWALAGAGPDLFIEEEVKQIVKYDPDEAKRLLAEAGYLNGLDLPYEYPVDREGDYVKHMELFIAPMKRAGINVVPLGIAYADYSNRKKSHQHYMNMINKDLVADDDSSLYAMFHPKSKANYDEVDDPQLTPLLEAQRREPDPAKRREVMRQAVRYINGEGFVGRAVYLEVEYEFWYPYVKGYAPNFNHPGWGALVNTWVEK